VARERHSNQAIRDILLSLAATRAQQDKAALKFYQQAATASASPTTLIQAQLNQLSLLLEKQWPAAQRCGLKSASDHRLAPSRTAVYARINFAQV